MRRLRWTVRCRAALEARWARLGLAVAALVVVALACCWRWRIWSLRDYREYQEISQYAIGPDLWFGRVTAGHDLDRLLLAHPPHRARRIGRFTLLTYYAGGPPPPMSLPFESLTVIAADGRLVYAMLWSCTWHRVFFDMSATDRAELDEACRRDEQRRLKALE